MFAILLEVSGAGRPARPDLVLDVDEKSIGVPHPHLAPSGAETRWTGSARSDTVTAVLPADHAERRPSLDDAPELTELVRAADVAVLGYHEYGADEARSDLASPDAPRDTDHWQPVDGAGRIAAWGYLREERPGAGTSDEYVRPSADPALGPWLLGRVLDRAAERARAAGLASYQVNTACFAADEAWCGWFAAAGFRPERRFHRMTADLAPGLPAPPVPDGVTLRRGGADERLLRDVYQVDQESFVDHWDFHPQSYERWCRDYLDGAGFAPDQWWVAYDGARPVAGLIGSNRMAEEGVGYVRVVGVVPAYRGRGLAKLLLRTAFADFAARGRSRAQLSVDTENSTGALQLYESVGMRPQVSMQVWRTCVAAPSPAAN